MNIKKKKQIKKVNDNQKNFLYYKEYYFTSFIHFKLNSEI